MLKARIFKVNHTGKMREIRFTWFLEQRCSPKNGRILV